MSELRARLTYANVMATIAVFIALGGASYAAFKLPKNSVGTKQLKKNAVTAAKIKNGAVTGAKVDVSTLTAVPNANHAKSADSSANASHSDAADSAVNAQNLGGTAAANFAKKHLEAVHLVGKPGEPPFLKSASNSTSLTTPAGFYKDEFGMVHLQGTVDQTTPNEIFSLPAGFRPSEQTCFAAPAFITGPTYKVNRVCINADTGDVNNDRGEGYEYIGLDGMTFRAEP